MTPHEAIRALAADERLPYLGLYPALVKKAQPNEVQVEPMGDWGEVVPPVGVWIPLAVGVPGVQATAKADSLVLVGFWAADPSRPYAVVTDPAGVEALTLETGDNLTVTVQGDVSISASGAVTVDAGGDASISASGAVTVDASGDATINAGGSATISATGSVSITGSSVSLG